LDARRDSGFNTGSFYCCLSQVGLGLDICLREMQVNVAVIFFILWMGNITPFCNKVSRMLVANIYKYLVKP
jgi:hypothetical protein